MTARDSNRKGTEEFSRLQEKGEVIVEVEEMPEEREMSLAMSQKEFDMQFDKVLNPLLSWLKNLEQTKAPIMSSRVTQMVGHDSLTQLESIWRP